MKIIVYSIMFLISLSITFAAGGGNQIDFGGYNIINPDYSCSNVRFCGDEENDLGCNAFRDEICPEDFGDWSLCSENNYGGNCSPCDPDCDVDCGQNLEISYSSANDPRYLDVPVTVSVLLNDQPEQNAGFLLFVDNGSDGWNFVDFANADCQEQGGGYFCSHTFTGLGELLDFMEPCQPFKFMVDFQNPNLDAVEGPLRVMPPDIYFEEPQNNNELQGTVNVRTITECSYDQDSAVAAVLYNLCKNGVCNRMAVIHNPNYDDGEYNYQFDTLRYSNDIYTLRADVVGGINGANRVWKNYSTIVEPIALNNGIGVGNNYQGSQVLNIVLARIKTWL